MRILLHISLLAVTVYARRYYSDRFINVETNSGPTDVEKQLWIAVGEFGHSLLTHVVDDTKPEQSVLISPYAVHSALSMAALGAEGSTRSQMKQAMDINRIPNEYLEKAYSDLISRRHHNKGKFILRLANRLFVDKTSPVAKSYIDAVRQTFHADAVNVDFAFNGERIKNEINEFVENKTNRLVQEILRDPPPKETVMLLVNALYFKGKWVEQMRGISLQLTFNNHCVKLQQKHDHWLTTQTTVPYRVSVSLDATLIRLPYDSAGVHSTSILIVLPNKAHSCDIRKWVQRIKWANIRKEVKKMKMKFISLRMPRFEVGYHTELKSALMAMGMDEVFTPGQADFSGILSRSDEPIHIDQVIHKSKMIVNQYGTEAVGSASIGFQVGSTRETPSVNMIINRSFFVAILYNHVKSSEFLPLFTGIVSTV